MKFIIAGVNLVILVVLVSVFGIVYMSPIEGKAHYCSKNLSDALSLICRDLGGYQEPFSGDNFAVGESKGIVEECCKKPCSVYQMSLYCKDSRPMSETPFSRLLLLFSNIFI